MASLAKQLLQSVNRVLERRGWELIRTTSPGRGQPSWVDKPTDPQPEPMPLANRNYRPTRMVYTHRSGSDERMKYLTAYLDVRGQRVLELGPLWGLFTFMLDKMGAAGIVGLEARPENIKTCEELKDVYGLDSATFVEQDIERLYRHQEQPRFDGGFDLVFAAGIFYHLPEPDLALAWFLEQAPALFLATHYWEPDAPYCYREPKFRPTRYDSTLGPIEVLEYSEPGDRQSGVSPHSLWLREPDIIRLLRSAGYEDIHVLGRDLHARYPHISIYARAGGRSGSADRDATG